MVGKTGSGISKLVKKEIESFNNMTVNNQPINDFYYKKIGDKYIMFNLPPQGKVRGYLFQNKKSMDDAFKNTFGEKQGRNRQYKYQPGYIQSFEDLTIYDILKTRERRPKIDENEFKEKFDEFLKNKVSVYVEDEEPVKEEPVKEKIDDKSFKEKFDEYLKNVKSVKEEPVKDVKEEPIKDVKKKPDKDEENLRKIEEIYQEQQRKKISKENSKELSWLDDMIVSLDAPTKKKLEKFDDIEKFLQKADNDKIMKLNSSGKDLILSKLQLVDGKVRDKPVAEILDAYDKLKDIEDINEKREIVKSIVKKVNTIYNKRTQAKMANPRAVLKSIRNLKI